MIGDTEGHVHQCKKIEERNTKDDPRNISFIAETYFKRIDSDQDNTITIEEANVYLGNNTKFKRSSRFPLQMQIMMVDINNDGKISPEEFDDSL